MRTLSGVLLVWLSLITCVCAEESTKFRNFVTAKGDQLFDGSERYRFMSFNIPNLHLVEDNFSFNNPNPWRWPNEFEITDALESIRQMGGKAVRIYVLSVKRDGSDMGDYVYVRGPGEFNEQAFRTLDKVLQIANRKGIRLIIPLVDNWKWWGGKAEYAKFRGKSPDDFWTDDQIIRDFEETIRFTLNRVNTFTGVAYRDDPAILGWETGNELDSTPEWTRRISAFIKAQDSNHLVIDGYALHGVRQESLDDPNIDVITTHHYPNTDTDYVSAITKAHQMTQGKKPYFVGEFGFAPLDEMERVMDTIIEKGISGGLLWSLRFRRREGGFYWHSEPSGGNLYKAYHWPGFKTCQPYGERKLFQLTRTKAFEIDGKPPAAIDAPAAPFLLPINEPSRISWQGSAGATSYDVQRATSKTGPWKNVGGGVSDAAVQYRPLFNDTAAEVGESYYYRVKAKNSAGSSATSNTVGPVAALRKVLVDECADFVQLHKRSEDIKILSREARKTQEDVHRFALRAGSTLEYHLSGPIKDWRVLLFGSNAEAELLVDCSIDGEDYAPCKLRREVTAVGSGDYGYSIPIQLSGAASVPNTRFLRIKVNDEDQADEENPQIQISRIEINHSAVPRSVAQPKKTRQLGSQLNPSILLFHKPYHTEGVKYVRRAAELGCRHVCVVVTLLCDINEDHQVLSYGIKKHRRYQPLNDQLLAEFKAAVQEVLAEVAAQDMELSVLAHLNAGGKIYEWRNHFHFDPLKEYAGYSYQDTVIAAIADAIAATSRPDRSVDIALAGEMGRSVFAYPESYDAMLTSLRNDPRLPMLNLGISFNFNNAAGQHKPTPAQQAALQQLIDSSDFVGMSNYRWFDLPIEPGDFAHAVEAFLADMRASGVAVPAALPIHFSEVGIGGGTEKGLAKTPAEAAKTPWHGTTDPRKNPWRQPEMRRFRVEFHRALLDFLAQSSATNPVTQAFLWSEGSWDPQEIIDAGFGDEQTIRMIRQHNQTLEAEKATIN